MIVQRTSERMRRQPVAPTAPTLILDSCCDPDGFPLHRSRASLRWPQCFSFRDGSNTRSTCRFRALITPIRANMVGPPRSATSMSASIAACHSGRSDSFFGRLVMWVAASAASGHSPTRSDHRSGRPKDTNDSTSGKAIRGRAGCRTLARSPRRSAKVGRSISIAISPVS